MMLFINSLIENIILASDRILIFYNIKKHLNKQDKQSLTY